MEEFVVIINTFVGTTCQLLAIFVISTGILKALWIFIKDSIFTKKSAEGILQSRTELGHAFSLGLGFLIGSSILKTTIAPTWTDIGQLTAIIIIRTVLNFFLQREINYSSAKHNTST